MPVSDEMVEAAIAAANEYAAHSIDDGVARWPDDYSLRERTNIRAMNRLALESADRAAWQPIETAPRDGTFVLLGRFVKYCEYGHAGMMVIDRYSRPEDNRGWIGWGKFSHLWPPTHWRHLPDAP